MKRGRAVGGGGILMQRYNTREAVCHLLSFSIRKNRKKCRLTHRYSACYKRRKIFQNFPLLFMQVPTWGVRTHDLWSVTRDMWQRKKQKIASVDIHPFKNQGYRCYAIRSSYNINLIVYNILYIQIYTYKHLPHTPSKIAVTCHVSRLQNCASIGISRWISMVKTHRYYGRTSRASLPAKWRPFGKSSKSEEKT